MPMFKNWFKKHKFIICIVFSAFFFTFLFGILGYLIFGVEVTTYVEVNEHGSIMNNIITHVNVSEALCFASLGSLVGFIVGMLLPIFLTKDTEKETTLKID